MPRIRPRSVSMLLFAASFAINGCMKSSLQEWAQSAPPIEPTFAAAEPAVHLGVIGADRPIRGIGNLHSTASVDDGASSPGD